jgi:DNA polymerase III delta subunit
MLTVFLQSDTARTEIQKRIDALRKNGADTVTISDANFSPEFVASFFGASDLFGKEHVIFLDRIFANPDARQFFWDNLSQFAGTLNHFILLEDKILADDIRTIEKEGGEVVKAVKAFGKPRPEFNIFALADALGERDKKKLWVLYVKAIRNGNSAEEISGTLFWQVKALLAIALGGGKSLNPFVKSKGERFVKNYSEEDLQKISFELVENYHKARRGGLPLAERLEQVILSL